MGQATLIDVRQAQVARGQSEVTRLRVLNAVNVEKLRLFEQLGVIAPTDVSTIELTDTFAVQPPTWKLEDLFRMAERQNPSLKALRERNWQPLPVASADLEAIVLTHAHLDHVGYLPRLVAQGFRGRVFCTPGTRDLCTLVLTDAAHIQEEDARDANRHGYS